MYSFKNDYNQIGHENILNKLLELKDNQYVGYGLDTYCDKAKLSIKKYLKDDVDIHFLMGGTQTNLIVISSLLKDYEAVIACSSGHINVHETGSIEAVGHKIITINNDDGKVYSKNVEEVMNYYNEFGSEHMVKPKMVYISNTTEIGTIYYKKELSDLYETCKKHNLILFLDGARLSYSLACEDNDIKFKDYKDLVDIFYVGGTKCGAMFGEAVVFNDKKYSENFRYNIKQRGGMLAKGFLLGIQFDELFKDGLYFELGKKAMDNTYHLIDGLKELGVEFRYKPISNQVFIKLSDEVIKNLEKDFMFEINDRVDNVTSIRLVISWATKKEAIDELIAKIKEYL